FFFLVVHIMWQCKVILFSVLLFQSHLYYLINKWHGATIQNRNLMAIQFDKHIVHFHSRQCRHAMLNGMHSYSFKLKCSASAGIYYQFNISINYNFLRGIYTLKFYSMIFRCWFKSHVYLSASMQAYSRNGKTTLYRLLFLIHVLLVIRKI